MKVHQKHKMALDAKDEEHKEIVRSRNARIEELEAYKGEATGKAADHDKNMAGTLASLQALELRLQNTEKDLMDTKAALETAKAKFDQRTKQASDAYKAADKLWHELEAVKAANEEPVDPNVKLAEDRDESHRLQQDREAGLDAQDEVQLHQNDDAASKVDEDLDACHDYGTDKDYAAEPEIEELPVEAVVDGDDLDGKSSQHRGSEGGPEGEDSNASHPLQI